MRIDEKALTEALSELSSKSLKDIQVETAYKWASRACAAGMMFRREGLPAWAADAKEYAHEAVEHAALCGDDNVLRDVRKAILTFCGPEALR